MCRDSSCTAALVAPGIAQRNSSPHSQIRAALDALTPFQRQAIELHYLHEHTYQETGQLLGISRDHRYLLSSRAFVARLMVSRVIPSGDGDDIAANR